jgi:hypothetical protein
MFEHEIPLTDAQRQHVCTCCGHIMVPGRESKLEFKKEKRAAEKSAQAGQRQPERPKGGEPQPSLAKVITCGHCGRLTETKLPAPAPISRRKARTKTAKALTLETAPAPAQAPVPREDPPQKGTANASSKKRAKSRKAGLQALLEQSNASKGSKSGLGLGLSLADFMQK